jgi:hypothetical protein
VLDLAHPKHGEASDIRRVLKVALKTARSCIESSEAAYAAVALQKSKDHIQNLRELEQGSDDQESVADHDACELDYLTLRMLWSWQDDRVDIAEHMFAQADKLSPALAQRPEAAERLAEVLLEIGSGLHSRHENEWAVQWLDRANTALSTPDLNSLTREGTELRLTILHGLVKANIGVGSPESLETAGNVVQYIESEIGQNKVLVLLLKLELINAHAAETFDGEAVANILSRMTYSITSDANLKLWVHHVRKLHDKAPGLARDLVDDLLERMTQPEIDQLDRIEKLALLRIWMTTSHGDSVELVVAAHKNLAKLDRPLSVDATAAAHTLIWKSIEAAYTQGSFELGAAWCDLALDRIFQHAGANTVAKLQRKLLLCAISRNDMVSATSIFFSMSEETKADPLTRYLAFKVAVRNGDIDIVADCLSVIADSGANDLLYACVLEANQANDQLCTLQALKKLQTVYGRAMSHIVHLPAVYRTMIRIICMILKRAELDMDDRALLVQDLCDAFDGVVSAVSDGQAETRGKTFDYSELDWFCRTAYNLGMKGCGDWDLPRVVQILTACTLIVAALPRKDLPLAAMAEISLKLLFCHFVIAAGLVALAREEENDESRLQNYLVMQHHVKAFEKELEIRMLNLDENCQEDMLYRLSRLLVFDFEGATALKQWEQLGDVVRRVRPCQSVSAYQSMGDCLLRSSAPSQFLFSTMRAIIGELSHLEQADFTRLTKYIRCLFQAMLPVNEDRALQLIGEAASMAEQASGKGRIGEWPDSEVQWLASTAHNHAVSIWAAAPCNGSKGDPRKHDEWVREYRGFVDRYKKWSGRALELARLVPDGGSLALFMEEQYKELDEQDRNRGAGV